MSERFRDKTRRLGGRGRELEDWIKDGSWRVVHSLLFLFIHVYGIVIATYRCCLRSISCTSDPSPISGFGRATAGVVVVGVSDVMMVDRSQGLKNAGNLEVVAHEVIDGPRDWGRFRAPTTPQGRSRVDVKRT